MADLQNPVRRSLIGEVLSIKEIRMADFEEGKFRHDCKLVTVEPVDGGPVTDIYITVDQFAKYGISGIVFVGNIVNFSIDDNIAGETGFIDPETQEWTLHEKSFSSFAGANNVGFLNLIGIYGKKGVGADIVGSFIKSIEAQRAKHASLGAKPKVVESAEETAGEPEPEA